MDTIVVTEKLILHVEKEQVLAISFWEGLPVGCKLHTEILLEPTSIKDFRDAIDLYLEDNSK